MLVDGGTVQWRKHHPTHGEQCTDTRNITSRAFRTMALVSLGVLVPEDKLKELFLFEASNIAWESIVKRVFVVCYCGKHRFCAQSVLCAYVSPIV